MQFNLYKKRLTYIYVQRNVLLALSTVLLAIILLQSILLFFKNERIIISPPELTSSFWVEGNRFSTSYLEEMSLFFTQLLLNVSEISVLTQGEVLLRYVLPESYGTFKSKLLSDEKRLKKQQLSLNFVPQEVVFSAPMIAEISGILMSYVGAKKVSQVRETYKLVFSQRKSRIFLESFQMIKSDQEPFDEIPA